MCVYVFTGALIALVDDAPQLFTAHVTECWSGVRLQVKGVPVLLNGGLHGSRTS